MFSVDRLITVLDPGKVTGVALLDPAKKSLETFEWDMTQVFSHFYSLCSSDILVVENFVLRPGFEKRSRVYEPLWIIGACKYVAQETGCSLILQEPSEAKTWADRKRLKEQGIAADKLKGDHRLDACRHLSLYLGKIKQLGLLDV